MKCRFRLGNILTASLVLRSDLGEVECQTLGESSIAISWLLDSDPPGHPWLLNCQFGFPRATVARQAHLRGFFCFQVQKHHYVAFVYNRGRQEWVLLDDDQAFPVSWRS